MIKNGQEGSGFRANREGTGSANLQKLIQQDPELGRTVLANIAQYFLERLKETRQELKIHFKTLFKSVNR